MQRLKATARQQLEDAASAQLALERAVALLAVMLKTQRERGDAQQRTIALHEQREEERKQRLRGVRDALLDAPLIKPPLKNGGAQ